MAVMSGRLLVRTAVVADAPALSQLAQSTFRDTFGTANRQEDMDLHCRSNYGPEIQAREIVADGRVTLLCEHEGALIGFAQLQWGNAPACVEGQSPAEIQRLYVASQWHGKGAAQMLMNACLDEMQARAVDVVWLGVWEHNPRAISFYEKFAFTAVGEHVFALGADPQRDIVMSRRISARRR